MLFAFIGCLVVDSQPDIEAFESNNPDVAETVVETHTVEETPEETLLEEDYVYTCEGGIERWNSCFDMPLSSSLECTDEVFAELALIESLQCDELYSALELLPLCKTIGIGCPEHSFSCTEPLDATSYRELLDLSRSDTVRGINDVERRVEDIRQIFASYGDIRGAFASVYSPITQRAVESISRNTYSDSAWAEDLVVAFSKRYFKNLRAALLDRRTTQSWDRYYQLSEYCSVTPLRIGAQGILVHLIVDLPHTLVDIGSSAAHKEDFDVFGMELVDATADINENLWVDYGIESEHFFNGFFLGQWVDSITHEGAMTTFMFQTIRNKAWNNGMWLQDWREGLAEAEIYSSWRAADGMLATWDIMND